MMSTAVHLIADKVIFGQTMNSSVQEIPSDPRGSIGSASEKTPSFRINIGGFL
jgi:hypothetical protein